ncbi:phosphate-binding protein [Rhodospirillum rubrum]|uniref:PstS family phosphate ABC transporter substrate-binding protein n=1 Tax=Rhodospirillum rubrum TaxID=1085 RepID=UPI001908FD13|nr:PstS family phosphate ABC transporter substrate-binding protein [Rhodospirillum rubrum]MBK1664785.1 phosphate-binding protein [Rhodospirillum rubrum]MBK1676633.1 phosphate-binding protein [Rhodospirillum rubrum]
MSPRSPIRLSLAILGLLGGLLGGGAEPARAAEGARSQARIVGSSTMFPLTAAVAERLSRLGLGQAPLVEVTGTGAGFHRFCVGVGLETPDLVAASRTMTDQERARCRANGVDDIGEIYLGHGAVVLARSWQTPFPALTRRMVWMALADEVPRKWTLVANPNRLWSDIAPGLPAVPIRIFGPPPSSGTRDYLASALMDPGCLAFPLLAERPAAERETACRRLREDGAFIEAGEDDDRLVKRLVDDPAAIGFIGYAAFHRNGHLVSAIPIEGIAPTIETITEGSYPLTTQLILYVKTAHLGLISGLDRYVQAFTAEQAIGEDGYLRALGLVPVADSGKAP